MVICCFSLCLYILYTIRNSFLERNPEPLIVRRVNIVNDGINNANDLNSEAGSKSIHSSQSMNDESAKETDNNDCKMEESKNVNHDNDNSGINIMDAIQSLPTTVSVITESNKRIESV